MNILAVDVNVNIEGLPSVQVRKLDYKEDASYVTSAAYNKETEAIYIGDLAGYTIKYSKDVNNTLVGEKI